MWALCARYTFERMWSHMSQMSHLSKVGSEDDVDCVRDDEKGGKGERMWR
jgi:hypothetical protein